MLTLKSGSACDVCAEEYAPQCLPHSIPCGHVLCASCCSAIVEKTTPRLQPACPFCRESFSPDSVRLIRMDFTTSGWSTPRRYPHFEPGSDFIGELLAKRTEHLLRFDPDPRSKSEARRLEDKVARIAAKKCSVEEVSALQKELEDWLKTVKDDQQHSALFLSAALLRAILMNHLVHSEASRTAKSNELALKSKIENLEFMHHALDVQHNRQKKLLEQKNHECQQLRSLASSHGVPLPLTTPPSADSTPPASPRATSPTSYSRFGSLHSRSISTTPRPITPATPSHLSRSQTSQKTLPRSVTPAVATPRSYTPAPVSTRSMTPGPGSHYSSASAYASRSQTPAPASAHSHSHTYSAAVPPLPTSPKHRRLSQSSPPKIVRSTSEEKADARQRWIPPSDTRVLVETEAGSYYQKLHGSPLRPIGVSAKT